MSSRPVWSNKLYNSLSYRARLCEKEKERLGKKGMKKERERERKEVN